MESLLERQGGGNKSMSCCSCCVILSSSCTHCRLLVVLWTTGTFRSVVVVDAQKTSEMTCIKKITKLVDFLIKSKNAGVSIPFLVHLA